MFERFTENARQIVVGAQEEARAQRHNYIGTEHLLLGLLRDRDDTPAQVLGAYGVTLERARAQIAAIVGPGEEATHGQIPFTPRGKKVLELALRESLARGANEIRPEHILRGLLREQGGIAERVLADLGALDAVRAELEISPDVVTGDERDDERRPRRPSRWERAHLMWRPEGVELRVPLAFADGRLAALANDPAWSAPPLAGLAREIWRGWLAVRSPTLLDDADPHELRAAIDGLIARAEDGGGHHDRAADFMRALREPPR
jgi:hypothetical protein